VRDVEEAMATLHIEHGITDFPTWKAAFDRFAAKRAEAGVTAHRIHLLYDDPTYLVLQLDFPSVTQAQAFRDFLEARVWSTPANAPGLAGTPRARVLVAAPGQ
jgi:hypothetical protein